jgi:hypothetical protein
MILNAQYSRADIRVLGPDRESELSVSPDTDEILSKLKNLQIFMPNKFCWLVRGDALPITTFLNHMLVNKRCIFQNIPANSYFCHDNLVTK